MKIRCTACGKESTVAPFRRGNTALEIILWFMGVIVTFAMSWEIIAFSFFLVMGGHSILSLLVSAVGLLPAFIYSLWRNGEHYYKCPYCTSTIVERLEDERQGHFGPIFLIILYIVFMIILIKSR